MVRIPSAYDSGLGQTTTRTELAPQQALQVDAGITARALAGFGQTLQDTSDSLMRVQDDLDTIEVQKADVAYLSGLSKIVNGDGQNAGYASMKGDNAIRQYEPTVKAIEDLRNATLGALSSDRVKNKFDQIVQKRNIDVFEGLTRHLQSEKRTAQIANSDATIQQNINFAISNMHDPKIVDDARNRVIASSLEIAELTGQMGDARRLFVDENVNKLYIGMVNKITSENPLEAPAFLERPDVKASMEKMGVYQKYKDYSVNKLLHMDAVRTQREIYNVAVEQNEMLSKPQSLAAIEAFASKSGVSQDTVNFILKQNGYGQENVSDLEKYRAMTSIDEMVTAYEQGNKTDAERSLIEKSIAGEVAKGTLSAEKGASFAKKLIAPTMTEYEKDSAKESLIGEIKAFSANDKKDLQALRNLQDRIVVARNQNILTQKEMLDLQQSYVEPFAQLIGDQLAQQQASFEINTDLGFNALDGIIESMSPMESSWLFFTKPKEGEENIFLRNKARAYDLYQRALPDAAREHGLTMKQLMTASNKDKIRVLDTAQRMTVEGLAKGLGLGVYENVHKTQLAITDKLVSEQKKVIQNNIDKSYEKPKDDVDAYLKGFGL